MNDSSDKPNQGPEPHALHPEGPRSRSTRRRPGVLWVPPLLVFCVIFALSSIPGHAGPWLLFSNEDKLAHFGVFGVLGLTLIRAVWRTTDWPPIVCVLVTVASVGIAGIADELHQYFVPGRGVEWMDVIADTLGGLAASVVWVAWMARNKRSVG